jgi:hypothetical protein
MYVQYHYFTVHYNNKLDKTAVLVVSDRNVHVRYRIDTIIVVPTSIIIQIVNKIGKI